MGNETVDIPESHPEQSPENIFGNRNDSGTVHMDRTVIFRLCHGKGGTSIVERRKNDQFRMPLFHSGNGIETGEAVHSHGEVFCMIFHYSQGQNDGGIVPDGFPDLVGLHKKILHKILLSFRFVAELFLMSFREVFPEVKVIRIIFFTLFSGI